MTRFFRRAILAVALLLPLAVTARADGWEHGRGGGDWHEGDGYEHGWRGEWHPDEEDEDHGRYGGYYPPPAYYAPYAGGPAYGYPPPAVYAPGYAYPGYYGR